MKLMGFEVQIGDERFPKSWDVIGHFCDLWRAHEYVRAETALDTKYGLGFVVYRIVALRRHRIRHTHYCWGGRHGECSFGEGGDCASYDMERIWPKGVAEPVWAAPPGWRDGFTCGECARAEQVVVRQATEVAA